MLLLFSVIIIFINKIDQTNGQEWSGIPRTRQESYLNNRKIEQMPKSDWSWPINDKSKNIWSRTHLWLNKIGIKSFKKGIFIKQTNVRMIDLSENELKVIDFNEFANNSQLGKLDVSKNQISEIKPIQSPTVINITNLVFHNNDLSDISELCRLKKLKKLNLSRNRRLHFSKATFNCWSELTHLYLAETNLKNLNHDYQVLVGCNKLEYLDLSGNDLRMLCFELFPALPELADLNIGNNSLINLDVLELKRKCQVFSSIQISGNKWSCGFYWGTMKHDLDKCGITGELGNNNDCLESFVDQNLKKCLKIERQSTNITSREMQSEDNKCIDGLHHKQIWMFIVLGGVLFITELLLSFHLFQIINY
jgi:Leucine rich repeat